MTAVEWLIEELKKVHHPTEAMIMYAKKLEKQQIIDAQMDMFYYLNDMPYGMQYLIKRDSAEQFCETYGSKGSDEIKKAEEMGLYDKIELTNPNDSIFTSSQTEISDEKLILPNVTISSPQYIPEISDEEIENMAEVIYPIKDDMYRDLWTENKSWKEGAKWYREQLKQIQ